MRHDKFASKSNFILQQFLPLLHGWLQITARLLHALLLLKDNLPVFLREDMSEASHDKMSPTVIRVPLIQGLPNLISGSMEIY